MDLSSNLKAFVSQRLIPTVDDKRCAAIEILLGTPAISELILRGEFKSIKEIMEKSNELGMQTFDQALVKLYRDGKISMEQALKNADSENTVRLTLTLSGDAPAASGGGGGLSLELEEDQPNEAEVA